MSFPDQFKDFTLRCLDGDGKETYSVKTSLILLWRISGYFRTLLSFNSAVKEVSFNDIGKKHVDVIVHYAETGNLLQLLLDRTEFVILLDRFEIFGNIPSHELVTLGEEKLNEVEGLFMLLSINERMRQNGATMHLSLAMPIVSRFIKKMAYTSNNDFFHSFIPNVYFYEKVLKIYNGDQTLIKELVDALENMITLGGYPIEETLKGVDLCELVAKVGAKSAMYVVKIYFELYLENGIPIPDSYKLMFFDAYTTEAFMYSSKKRKNASTTPHPPHLPAVQPPVPRVPGAPLNIPGPQNPFFP